jgi:hypothetical protein
VGELLAGLGGGAGRAGARGPGVDPEGSRGDLAADQPLGQIEVHARGIVHWIHDHLDGHRRDRSAAIDECEQEVPLAGPMIPGMQHQPRRRIAQRLLIQLEEIRRKSLDGPAQARLGILGIRPLPG